MMKALLFLFPVYVFSILSISSDHAHFESEELYLEGNIQIDHDLGLLETEKAKVFDFQKMKKNIPASFTLEEGVLAQLKEGGVLEAEKAFFKMPSQTITFLSEKNLRFIHPEIHVTCKKAEGVSSSLFEVETFYFYDDVKIHYGEDFVASGGKGIYEKIHAEDFSGKFSLYPKIPELFCDIHRGKDVIRAHFLECFLKEKRFLFHHSEGHFFAGAEKISFQTKKLFWENDFLHFSEDVSLQKKDAFSLQTEELFYEKERGKLETRGASTLFFPRTEEEISLDGSIFVDENAKEIWAIPTDGPLTFKNPEMELFGEKGFFDYGEGKKLRLSKNVRMVLMPDGNLGYGVCEEIEYNPLSKELLLKAESGRVLFWKGDGSLKISAPMIRITKENEVEGIGDVHFAFSDEEAELFQNIFSNYLEIR